MASQVVSAAKRWRISILLDTYGELLTEKQRTFLHLYFEEDLSFGEIARAHGVTRQAIFDSVRHGEGMLEQIESALGLVREGWAPLLSGELGPEELVRRLDSIRRALAAEPSPATRDRLLGELDELIARLNPAEPEVMPDGSE